MWGNFTTAGGGGAARVAMWNGSAWSALGAGFAAQVYALAIGLDNNLYAGGFGNDLAYWDGSSWTTIATAVSDINELYFNKTNILFVGGSFTSIGGVSANRIAYWNGSTFFPMGSGALDNSIRAIREAENGLLYVGGQFTQIGGLSIADRVAVWNGTSWVHLPVDLPGSAIVLGIFADGDDIYFCFDSTGTATVSAITITANNGSRSIYPTLIVKRSGGTSATLEYLKNETTADTLWFNYALLDGETLTVDMTPSQRKVTSDFFGEVPRAILRGSDFAEFNLLPGDNDISVYIAEAGTPTLTCYLQYRQRHWSVDGVAA